METYPFLSDDWIKATRELREAFLAENTLPKSPTLRLNLVVTEVPFGEGDVHAHMDSSSGNPEIELGHLAKVDATVTVDYVTAKNLFVSGKMSAAMEAMQLGRIKVKGNMFKLLGLTKMGNDPASEKLALQIREITA